MLYTGSMNRDMDSAATLNLRQLWTYDRESRRRPGWADPEQADSDDEGFASLRGRMSISPSVSYDHSNKVRVFHRVVERDFEILCLAASGAAWPGVLDAALPATCAECSYGDASALDELCHLSWRGTSLVVCHTATTPR